MKNSIFKSLRSRKWSFSDIAFAVFVMLLLIPQTRKPIQVAVNRLKVAVWSPSTMDENKQMQLEPFTYRLTSIEGSSHNVAVGEGKVTFISYWATWCPPCIAELPSIQKLYEDYSDTVDFLLITQENAVTVRQFLAKKNYQLPVFFPKMVAPDLLEHGSIPTNYLIDQTGTIIVKETGAANWNSEKIRSILTDLVSKQATIAY